YAQGSWGPALSCVVCAGLYASLHLYLGVSIALVVFIPGLLWSYLYYRSRSVLLVSASHLACGLFYLYVLGV
ncbi:MAG: CPBP family intramembrane glutamic endopeptidase, partial [Myxococcota bacterium]